MKLIVDYSVLMNQSWNQMFSDNYVPTKKTELEEYLRNLSKNLFYLKCRFKPDQMILCLDDLTANWRKYYLADYYESRIVLIKDNSPLLNHPTYYYEVDGTIYKFEKFLQMMQWRTTKVVAKDVKELNEFRDIERFTFIRDINVIKTHEIYDACLKGKIPYYKGNRANTEFKGCTDRSLWKKYSFEQAPMIASILGAVTITSEYAEGDDCIAVAVKQACKFDPSEEIVVVSCDQDLYQLHLLHPMMGYYNPIARKMIALTDDEIRWKLLCKIAGGDGGDNINGMKIEGKKLSEVKVSSLGVYVSGKTTVNKLLPLIQDNIDNGVTGTQLYKPAYDWLIDNSEDDSFYKNMVMIYLSNIPESLYNKIAKLLIEAQVVDLGYTFDDVYLTTKDRIFVMNEATSDLRDLVENDN